MTPRYARGVFGYVPDVAQPPDKNARVILLDGQGFERGAQHGRAARDVIAVQWPKWHAELAATGLGRPTDIINDFVANTDFTTAMSEYAPDLLEEIRGIAKGAGLSANEVFAFSCMDELWCYIDAANALGPMDAFRGCSVVGVRRPDSGPKLLGQNMDLGPATDGGQTVLAMAAHDNEPAQLVVTQAGLIGLAGVNHHGVGVCVNTLMGLANARVGLPVAVVARLLARQRSLADAVALVKSVPHASGQAYTIGSPDGVVCLEASAHDVVEVVGDDELVMHTNHALANVDVKPGYATSIDGAHSTAERLKFLAETRPCSMNEIADALGNTSVPLWFNEANSHGRAITFASYIYEFASEPVMHLRIGETVEVLRVPTPR